MPSLDLLGWTAARDASFAPFEERGLHPARVMSEHKGGLALSWEGGELLGSPSARLRAAARAAVGDWVAFEPPETGHRAWVQEVLPRASAFVRKAAGREVAEQVVAANVDTVFLCTALGRDFNPRRLERYLALSWQSGARPVLVLTKLDLHPEQRVREVRVRDERGRHTTARRDLLMVPDGGLLLDSPGMRELQLWGAEEGVARAFADIEALAPSCRYADCSHADDAACAVASAVDRGG